MTLAAADAEIPNEVELVFTALPHAAAAKSVKKALDAGKKVVDLSADFRHANLENYEQAYGLKHPYPELLETAVYGLTEHARDEVAKAHLVANPGCYPTSVLLPLIPLLKSGLVKSSSIVIDSKSGTSGAGRSAKTDLLYCEINESLGAYGLPRHRHAWEMEEWATAYAEKEVSVRFVPHIIPMTRGMLSTLHLSGTDTAQWYDILVETYQDEPFVNVLPLGQLPATGNVKGSNRCDIGLVALNDKEAVVVSCIDNLLKGASGQAVQNANLMFGLDEGMGLAMNASWP
jgi:N-acetyl-gamma-glutamyl-phosphate reductase